MSTKHLSSINLTQGTANPAAASTGDLFYNTTTPAVNVYNGTTWVAVSGGGSGASSVTSVNTRTGAVTGVADLASANTFTDTQTTQVANFNPTSFNGSIISIKTVYVTAASWVNYAGKSPYSVMTLSAPNASLVSGNYYFMTFNNSTGIDYRLVGPYSTAWLYYSSGGSATFTSQVMYAQPPSMAGVGARVLQRLNPINVVTDSGTGIFIVGNGGQVTITNGATISAGLSVSGGLTLSGYSYGGTAYTPQLILNDGSGILTTPKAGAVEVFNGAMYYTDNVNTRNTVLLTAPIYNANIGTAISGTGVSLFGSSSQLNPVSKGGAKVKIYLSFVYTKSASGNISFNFASGSSNTIKIQATQKTYIAGGGLANESSIYGLNVASPTVAAFSLAAGTYHTIIEGYGSTSGVSNDSLYPTVTLGAGTLTILANSIALNSGLGFGTGV